MRISGKQIRDAVSGDASPSLSADLDVASNAITTTTSGGNIKLAPNGTGNVEIRGNGSNDAVLQLNCSANTHSVSLQAPPHGTASTYVLTLPINDGEDGQVLKTDGSGALAWVDQSAGGTRPKTQVINNPLTAVTVGGTGDTNSSITASELERIYIVVNASNDVTITLPDISSGYEGFKLQIKSGTAKTVKIKTHSSAQTISGQNYSSSTLDIATIYDNYTLLAAASVWHII